MANEITVSAASGQTLYAILRNSAAQPYNTGAPGFEAYTSAHYTSYALPLAEQGATGYYVGSAPAAFGPAGRYVVQSFSQGGAGPAAGDSPIGSGVLLWTGSAEVVGPLCNSAGQVALDLTQSVPSSNTAQTVGDALNAARAQAFGKWVLSGTTLTLYAADGTTAVRTFVLDNPLTPTQRT